MRKYLVAAVTALALLTAATGCSGDSTSGTDDEPKTLALSSIIAPDTFVPGSFGSGPTGQHAQFVYDSLLRNDENGEPTPNVATEWSYDAAQTTLNMTLRDGVSFTDGTTLDADADRKSVV